MQKAILTLAIGVSALSFAAMSPRAQDATPTAPPPSITGTSSGAQSSPATDKGKATGEIAEAARKFLATLDDVQRGKVVFDFKDSAQRRRWSNFPTGIFQRAGLRMGDLTQPQRDAAMAVLKAALSPQGYE